MSNNVDSPKVLVVDDEHLISDTLALILNHHGFKATSLYSGEEAVEWVEKFKPDIVVTDIRMGRVDGIEAAVHVRELHPTCRIILFSASIIDAPTRARIVKLGFEFLRKPVHPQLLLDYLS